MAIQQLNRYVDTERWSRDQRFKSLNPLMKLLIKYIEEQADQAGFIFPDWDIIKILVWGGLEEMKVPIPSPEECAVALGRLVKVWADRWQVRGFFPTYHPEDWRKAKAPNGCGIKAFREVLLKHVTALGDSAEVYQVAFEGDPGKLTFYMTYYQHKAALEEDSTRKSTPPHPPLGGVVPFPPLLASVQPCTAESKPGSKTVPPETGLPAMPETVHLPSGLAVGGGGGAVAAAPGDIFDILAWGLLIGRFLERSIKIADSPPFLQEAARRAQDVHGDKPFDRGLIAYLDHPSAQPKTPKAFLNSVDHWVQVGRQLDLARGCEHQWTAFDSPADERYLNGDRVKGRACGLCKTVEETGRYRNPCRHERAGVSALVTRQLPHFDENAPGHQVFLDHLICSLCGDQVEMMPPPAPAPDDVVRP